jgi:menaquinone-dependent protoporphyrinogen IX oxidase
MAMASVLIVYGTAEDQTAKISEYFAEIARDRGHDAEVVDAKEIEDYIERFEEETGWHPEKVGIFAGALLYSQYGFIKRRMMKRKDTVTSRDYEYTDWNEVQRFTEEFLKGFTRESARSPRERG